MSDCHVPFAFTVPDEPFEPETNEQRLQRVVLEALDAEYEDRHEVTQALLAEVYRYSDLAVTNYQIVAGQVLLNLLPKHRPMRERD